MDQKYTILPSQLMRYLKIYYGTWMTTELASYKKAGKFHIKQQWVKITLKIIPSQYTIYIENILTNYKFSSKILLKNKKMKTTNSSQKLRNF